MLHQLLKQVVFQSCYSAKIFQLGNQLPVPMTNFTYQDCYQPEYGFRVYPQGNLSENSHDLLEIQQAINALRPLHIYDPPRELVPEKTGKLCFLESTMSRWWENGVFERNYYLFTDSQGRQLWVFQDSTGKWYLHGIFG